jgi:transcriptional regulator with XRE-family HTH domain
MSLDNCLLTKATGREYRFSMSKKEIRRLGARIRHLREGKDWSQRQLSLAAKIDQGLLSRIESGTGNPGLETIAAIANAFGMTISEFTQGV